MTNQPQEERESADYRVGWAPDHLVKVDASKGGVESGLLGVLEQTFVLQP